MPTTIILPAHGEPNWDDKLNTALNTIVAAVNALSSNSFSDAAVAGFLSDPASQSAIATAAVMTSKINTATTSINSTTDSKLVTDRTREGTAIDSKIATAAVNYVPKADPRTFPFKYNGTGWEYGGVVVTALPAVVRTMDGVLFIGNTAGALPAWAPANAVWTKG